MAFIKTITKGSSSYDIQDARLTDLTATAAQLNKTASTTLAGFGITDANITNGVITLGANNITPLTAASTLDATKLNGTASIDTTGNASTASKVNNVLSFGTKTYDGSSAVAIEASDLGLSKAMNFIGISTTAITDGGNENPTIGGTIITVKNNGDVVLYGAQEFIYASNAWHKLGDTANYILKDEAPGYNDILTQTSAASTYATKEDAAIKAYPVVTSTGTMAWNQEYRLGSISALSITMPAPDNNYTSEVRFTFTASAAFTPALTCSGYTVLGTSDVSIASGKTYEMSYAVLSGTQIGVACKEWA